jgi:hypothetical protein
MKAKILLSVGCFFLIAGVVAQSFENVSFYLPFNGNLNNQKETPFTFDAFTAGTHEAKSPEFSEGKFGECLQLTHDYYVRSSERAHTIVNSFTLTFHFMANSLSSALGREQFLFQQRDGVGEDPSPTNTGRAFFTLLATDQPRIFFGGAVTLVEPIMADIWYHVAIVINREERKKQVYIDGELKSELDAPAAGFETSAGEWVIGISKQLNEASANQTFHGKIDDLLLIQEALSVETINQIKENGVASLFSTNVGDITAEHYYNVFSNHGTIQLDVHGLAENTTVEVFSITGQRIIHRHLGTTSGHTIIGHVPNNGIYIVRVQSDTGVHVQKVMVQ